MITPSSPPASQQTTKNIQRQCSDNFVSSATDAARVEGADAVQFGLVCCSAASRLIWPTVRAQHDQPFSAERSLRHAGASAAEAISLEAAEPSACMWPAAILLCGAGHTVWPVIAGADGLVLPAIACGIPAMPDMRAGRELR